MEKAAADSAVHVNLETVWRTTKLSRTGPGALSVCFVCFAILVGVQGIRRRAASIAGRCVLWHGVGWMLAPISRESGLLVSWREGHVHNRIHSAPWSPVPEHRVPASRGPLTTAVITDIENPKFDLEKLIEAYTTSESS